MEQQGRGAQAPEFLGIADQEDRSAIDRAAGHESAQAHALREARNDEAGALGQEEYEHRAARQARASLEKEEDRRHGRSGDDRGSDRAANVAQGSGESRQAVLPPGMRDRHMNHAGDDADPA